MTRSFEIAVFDGDGIGPEIMGSTVAILKALADQNDVYDLRFTNLPAGAAHYAKAGEGLPDVRCPDDTEIPPPIDLRKAFNLFAGVRPVRVAQDGLTP